MQMAKHYAWHTESIQHPLAKNEQKGKAVKCYKGFSLGGTIRDQFSFLFTVVFFF